MSRGIKTRTKYVKLSFNDIEFKSLQMCANYNEIPLATFIRLLIMEKAINDNLIKKAPTKEVDAYNANFL